jgi:hypothetical protein
MEMETVHHIRYTVLDRDDLVEYIRRNFGLEPDGLRFTSSPMMKEAMYQLDDGAMVIQITEPLAPEWNIVRHLAKQGPGVFHTNVAEYRSVFIGEFEDDDFDEFNEFGNQFVQALVAERNCIREAGLVDGTHFTDYVEHVKQLKLEKRHDEAIDLLLKLLDATEAESRATGESHGVAPWYYEQLASFTARKSDTPTKWAYWSAMRRSPKPRAHNPPN